MLLKYVTVREVLAEELSPCLWLQSNGLVPRARRVRSGARLEHIKIPSNPAAAPTCTRVFIDTSLMHLPAAHTYGMHGNCWRRTALEHDSWGRMSQQLVGPYALGSPWTTCYSTELAGHAHANRHDHACACG